MTEPGLLSPPPFSRVAAFLLWGISATMTVSLFLDLAGTAWYRLALAGVWAASLEAAKVYSWLRGGLYRLLSTALIFVTLFSAAGIALHTVEVTHTVTAELAQSTTQAAIDQRRSIASLQDQIDTLVVRLSQLPSDYITATADLNRQILVLRDRLTGLQTQGQTLQGSSLVSTDLSTFGLLASVLRFDRKLLEILTILGIAVLTEVSALALASETTSRAQTDLRDPKPSGRQLRKSMTAEDYLKSALDHSGSPRLLGRRVVARRLDLTETQAKGFLRQLLQGDRIKREGKTFQATGR